MFVIGASSAFLVIYSLKDIFYCLIPFSSSFIERNLPSARLFWEKCILPELFACHFTNQKKTSDLSLTDISNTENAYLPCFCSTIKKDEEIVLCSVSTCLRKVFHRSCVLSHLNLKRIYSSWKCDLCTKAMSKKKNEEKRLLKNKVCN